jgi:hypothetical protein
LINLSVPDTVVRPNESAPVNTGWFSRLNQGLKSLTGFSISNKGLVYGGDDSGSGWGAGAGGGLLGGHGIGMGGSSSSWSQPDRFLVGQKKAPTPTEVSDFRDKLKALDRKLSAQPEHAGLWKQRAELCRGLSPMSALISFLTACLIEKQHKLMVQTMFQFAATRPEFAILLKEDATATERGTLLAAIRSKTLEAEFHYGLHLAFATRWNDGHIFLQAIESMRSGYAGEKRRYFLFTENRYVAPAGTVGAGGSGGSRVSGGDNADAGTIQLLSGKQEGRIRDNVNKFLQYVGCKGLNVVCVVRSQFNIMLETHLGKAMADRLAGRIPYSDRQRRMTPLTKRYVDLQSWPLLPQENTRFESTKRWWEVLSMIKLKELPLNDLFTGYLYRPTLKYDRYGGESGRQILGVKWLAALPEKQLPPVDDGKALAGVMYKRYSDGHADWNQYFLQASGSWWGKNLHAKARSQHVLLCLVTQFGPMKEFAKYIEKLDFKISHDTVWDIYALTLFCDWYRLHLAYKIDLDEQGLFNLLLNFMPPPPKDTTNKDPAGWTDFRDSAEQVILCLFLNGSNVRRFQLDNMLRRALDWLEFANNTDNETMTDEALTILSYLEAGVLTDLVPEDLEMHQFQERRRALWIDHARLLASEGETAWKKWITTCQL